LLLLLEIWLCWIFMTTGLIVHMQSLV